MKINFKAVAVFLFAMLLDKYIQINMLSLTRVLLAAFSVAALCGKPYPTVIVVLALCVFGEKVIAVFAAKPKK